MECAQCHVQVPTTDKMEVIKEILYLFSIVTSGDNFSSNKFIVENNNEAEMDTQTAEKITNEAICEILVMDKSLAKNVATIT